MLRVIKDKSGKIIPNNVFSCKENKYEGFHLEFEGNDVKVVSEGFIDLQAQIQSERGNAGLINIMKLQEMRYGTIDNAIIKNKEKQVFADVSEVPLSVAEDTRFVESRNKAASELASRLGVSVEALATMSQTELYNRIISSQHGSGSNESGSTDSGSEGGNE